MTAELPAELLDAIRNARVDLDLQPDCDPAEALLDRIEERGPRTEKVQAENEGMVRLADQLGATLAALDEKKRALRETEEALGAVGADLEKTRGAAAANSHETDASATFGAEKEATLRRVRVRVEGLKAEVGAQQAERRQLCDLLGVERKRLAALSESGALTTSPGAPEEASVVEPAGRPILPEYSDALAASD
jgi:chromosome segregation ATPase